MRAMEEALGMNISCIETKDFDAMEEVCISMLLCGIPNVFPFLDAEEVPKSLELSVSGVIVYILKTSVTFCHVSLSAIVLIIEVVKRKGEYKGYMRYQILDSTNNTHSL